MAGLSDKDNHVRAIASQVFANLAKSDPEKRMLRDFDVLQEICQVVEEQVGWTGKKQTIPLTRQVI